MALQDAAEGAIQDRFVEVLADLGPGARPRWRCASGFLVDGRHVLTSLHAVIGGELTVRRAGDAPGGPKREWPARLLLAGDLEGADLAILTLEQDAGPLRPAGYAQVARRTPQPVVIERCSAVGFPRFTARSDAEDAVRDSAHVEGRIPTSQNLVSGLLTLQTTHTPQPLPPARSGLSASAWSGMSGAAVLAGGRIIAVVSEHAPRQGPSDLTVVPITLIDTLPEADAWWAVLATRPALLPTLPPPAPPPAPASVISQPPGQLLEHVTDPFDLEVHRPIRVIGHGGDLPALPRYVRRAHDDQLAAITARAQAGHSGLAVLVGGSSTGKTRACWEALTVLRRSGQGWRLWHPIDPTRPEAALAALAEVGPYTVVWLNEAQFYLSPDGLGDKVAAGLRALLRDPTRGPVLIMATLWPEHWSTLTTRPVGGEDPHAQARELLADRKIHLPDAFTDHDSRHLADAAAADPRLAEARHHAAEGKITQYLAGVPVLLDRYSEAPPAARALIHAAMDARRLGHGPHLPYQLLAEAAPGYLTDTEWNDVDDDWLEAALAYTAQPCNGIPGPLTRIRPRTPAPGPPVYRLADYLEQTGRTARAGHYPPETFWTAATQLTSADTLHTLGHAARNRGLLQTAAHLWKHATRLGHPEAALHLTTLLTHAHPHDQRPARYAARHATLDDPRAIGRLLDGLQRAGADEQVALLADRAARHATLDDPDTVGRLLDGLQRAGADEQVALLADRAARHAALDDPDTVGRLLDRLRRAGTNEQIALLLGRDPARHTALDDPDSVGYLLDSLREAGADEQIAALADRAARHATLDDPDTVGRLLDSLRRAGANEQIALLLGRDPARHTALDDPRSVGYLLDSLREAGADEQIAALADRAIRHTAVDDPRAIGRLLDSLRRVDANEQIAALLGRDPARHATLDDLDAIGRLLDSLQEAGAHEQVALLADRAARHIAVDDPRAVDRLLDGLREVGAHEQVTALADRAARHTAVDDPRAVDRLLDGLREVGAHEQVTALADRAARHTALDDPRAVDRLLDGLREVGAHEQVTALADRAARHTALDDPRAIGRLLDSLRRVGAHGQVAALLGRDPARHTALDDPRAVGWLLDSLRKVDAHEQIAALLGRDPARHTALDDPDAVGWLLDSLRKVDAHEQVAILAGRAVRNATLDDPDAVGRLLDSLREAGADEQIAALADRAIRHTTLDDPDAVGRLLDRLRRVGADEQIAALADRAARHTALDDPRAIGRLLDSLRRVGAHGQVAALLGRDPARYTAVDDPRAVGWLLSSLRRVGADGQIAALADRAARHTALDNPRAVGYLLDSLREVSADEQIAVLLGRDPARHATVDSSDAVGRLLDRLRRVGAHEQIAVLSRRLPALGLFEFYCDIGDSPSLKTFGCRPDGSPARRWDWDDLM